MYSKYSVVDKCQCGTHQEKDNKRSSVERAGSMSYLASKGPWKSPSLLLALSVSHAGSVLPQAREGARQVIPTGCAKDELPWIR